MDNHSSDTGASYWSRDDVKKAAANVLMECVKDKAAAGALAGMSFPEAFMSSADIFANEKDIYLSSIRAFEALGGAPKLESYDKITTPASITAYSDKGRQELFGQQINQGAAITAVHSVISSMAGVGPQSQVTIQSVIPACTTFERPASNLNAQPATSEAGGNVKSQARKAGNMDTVNRAGQTSKEDFNVEYTQSNYDLSEYLFDTTGGSALGFLGGLLLSGKDNLDEKFLRIPRLPVHVFEEVVKNAYQSGIIQQAKKLADKEDIYRALSGGKATVTTLDNIESCFFG